MAVADHVLDEIGISANILLAALLGLTTADLLVGISISSTSLAAGLAAFLLISGVRAHVCKTWRTSAAAVVVVLALTAGSIWFAKQTVDTSYDGVSYHQVGTISLASGWNPARSPHVVNWWQGRTDSQAAWAPYIQEDGLQIDHFPKAAWILGALVTAAIGSLNAAKWINSFLLVVGAFIFFRGLRSVRTPAWFAGLCAVAAAASPIVIDQLVTSYVDGALGSVLLIMSGAVLWWLADRRPAALFIVFVGASIAANLKFTV